MHNRLGDSKEYFEHIKELKDEFVVRVRTKRIHHKNQIDKSGVKKNIKLKDSTFPNQKEYVLDKLKIKGKVYQQMKINLQWDEIIIDKNLYYCVKITLKTRDNKNIYKDPMLLVSNIKITNYMQAQEIYHTYLLRSKIEDVFKFLKNVLGLEDFQVRDWESIKNLIALCFFIGSYFYEIESSLIENKNIAIICAFANSKGKVTRHFFYHGLAAIYSIFEGLRIKEELNLTSKQWRDVKAFGDIVNDDF